MVQLINKFKLYIQKPHQITQPKPGLGVTQKTKQQKKTSNPEKPQPRHTFQNPMAKTKTMLPKIPKENYMNHLLYFTHQHFLRHRRRKFHQKRGP